MRTFWSIVGCIFISVVILANCTARDSGRGAAAVLAAPAAARMGDRVWSDLNGNGLQDAGEPGIAGVTVRALGTFDFPPVELGRDVTDANGRYVIGGLGAFWIRLEFVPSTYPAGYTISPADRGADDALDSDVTDSSTGWTGSVPFDGVTDNMTIDLGLMPPGVVEATPQPTATATMAPTSTPTATGLPSSTATRTATPTATGLPAATPTGTPTVPPRSLDVQIYLPNVQRH